MSSVEEASPRPSHRTSQSPGQSLLRQSQRGQTASSLHSQTQNISSSHDRRDTLSEITVGGSQITGPEDEASQVEVEGSSSLAAHSNFAADFLKRAVNWNESDESSGGARGLLDTLRQIVGTIEQQHRLPDSRLPARTIAPLPARQDRDLPPFEVAVGVIRKARSTKLPIFQPSFVSAHVPGPLLLLQKREREEEKTRYECQVALCVTILILRSLAENNVVFEYFDKLLPSTSLAELCMNVYFSIDYDESEFIIVNSMLYCACSSASWGLDCFLTVCTALFEESDDSNSHQGEDVGQLREYRSCCALNIEKALAALSLFVNRSHTMALALVLGVSSGLRTDGLEPMSSR